MAAVEAPLNPRQLKDISVIFDKSTNGREFRKAVQSFQFVPSSSVSVVTGGTPDAVYTDQSAVSWTLNVKFIQDSETLGALTDWLFSQYGTVHHVDFVPYGGTGWGADIVVPAGPIGGDMNTWLSDTVTFAVRGKPARTVDDPATPQQ